MIHRPIAIVAPMLVPYLSSTEIANLSMTNTELRALLQSYLFPSINNVIDPDFKHWDRIPQTSIEHNLARSTRLPLAFMPSMLTALSTHMPLFPTVVDLTAVTSLIVDHGDSCTLLSSNDTLSAPRNYFAPLSQLCDLTDAQAFFRNLIHLKITCDFNNIVDPETWNSISFDSLVSLSLPCDLEFDDGAEDAYMSSICKSLTVAQISPLRTLTFTDCWFTNKELDKYTLSPVVLNLISSELLPVLSTVRFPLIVEVGPVRLHKQADEKFLFDRQPLLRQLLRASAKHAIINSRSTPWRLGTIDDHMFCVKCTLGSCVCELSTPILLSDEYDDLLKIAHKCQEYIHVPEFFTPYLTIDFSTLTSVESAFSHAAALTPLSALRLSFPPPIVTSLFNGITRLTLVLPVEQDELAAYQPHLSALPVSFPALTHLALSLTGKLLFGGLTLPHLQLQTLDISARAISTKLPCGHCKFDFGAAQAQRVVVREVHMCIKCWDPLQRAGTKAIAVFGIFDINRELAASRVHTPADDRKVEEWEHKILASFEGGGREVTMDSGFVQWSG